MSEWKEYKLEDVCLKITDGSHFSPKVDPNGKRIIGTVKDMLDYSFNIENCKRINEEEYEKLLKNDCRPIHNDILFSKDGTIGKVIVFDFELDIVLLSSIAIIRPNTSLINPRFLAYILKSKKSQDEINENYKSGSAIPRVILRDFKRFPISIPDLPTQIAIAEILSSLDDKIELNNKINHELENLAQTLFKQWFIDFEFPNENGEPYKSSGGEMVDSELGEIPKGWGIYSMADLLQTISKTYPLKSVSEVVFLNTGDIQDGKFLHCNKSNPKTLPGQAKKSIQKNDILYSEIRPANKRYAFVHFDSSKYVVSTKLMVLRSKVPVSSLFQYFILTQSDHINYLQQLAESRSGTFPQITFTEISTIKVVLPSFDNLNQFVDSVLEPFFNNKFKIESENTELTTLRDTLLPKLISGELEVSQIKTAS